MAPLPRRKPAETTDLSFEELAQVTVEKVYAAAPCKKIDGRAIEIRRETKLERCVEADLLFIGRTELANWPEILKKTQNLPILTVAEWHGFAETGGMIELKLADRQVCFDLNQRHLKEAGLRASGQMVKIARNVYR